MSAQRKRRQWKSSEKMQIVLVGREPGGEVSELCRREGIPTTFDLLFLILETIVGMARGYSS